MYKVEKHDVEAGKDDVEVCKVRTNRLSRPITQLQISSWILLALFTMIYFGCFVPSIHKSWQPAAYIIPGLSLLVHLVCHVAVITIDPGDPAVLLKKRPTDCGLIKRLKENRYCYQCQVAVASRSHHCKDCGKCVSEFDHHCSVLNKCIGGQNYRWFLASLITLLIVLVPVMIVTVELTLQACKELDSGAKFMLFYIPVHLAAWLTVLVLFLILGLMVLIFLILLLGFHMYLFYNNLTTYDHILRCRENEEKQRQEKQEKQMQEKQEKQRQEKQEKQMQEKQEKQRQEKQEKQMQEKQEKQRQEKQEKQMQEKQEKQRQEKQEKQMQEKQEKQRQEKQEKQRQEKQMQEKQMQEKAQLQKDKIIDMDHGRLPDTQFQVITELTSTQSDKETHVTITADTSSQNA